MSGYAEKLASVQTHGGGTLVLNPRNPMHSAPDNNRQLSI